MKAKLLTLHENKDVKVMRQFSPSSLARSFASPGSMFLPYVKSTETEASRKGTLLHSIAESMILEQSYQDPGLSQFEINNKVRAYVDFCKKLIASGGWYSLEGKVIVKFEALPLYIGGTADFIHFSKDGVFTICDLKTGWFPVDPQHNLQLLCYATFGMLTYAKILGLTKMRHDIKKIRLCIAQNDEVKIWEASYKDMKDFYLDLQELITVYLEHKDTPLEKLPDQLFRKGSHCKFCPDKLQCCDRIENKKLLKELL